LQKQNIPNIHKMATIVPLVLLWLGHFLVDFMLGIWSVYKTMSAIDLGIAGLLAAACALIGEGTQFIFGNLSDRGYRNRLIILGVALASANLFLVFSESYFVLLILFMLTCIGSGAFHPTAVSLIGSLTDRQKGLYISIFSSGGALGMALSQIIFTKTHTTFNGNTLPLLILPFILILVLLKFGYFKKIESSPNAGPKNALNLKLFKEYFNDRSLRSLYIAQVCNQTIFWGAIFLLPDVLATRGYDESIAFGGGHFAFIIGSAFMMIPSGYLADRFSPRSVILTSSFLGMLFFYTFLFMPQLPVIYLLPLLAIGGSFLGIVQPVAVACGNEIGKKNPGLVSAFTMGLVWCVSETIGPAGSGLLSKLFTDDAPAKSLMVFGLLFPVLLYYAYQLPSSQSVTESETC
jgi:FSR family fosmidomycin resistance protein-like MFS transporter